MTGERVPARHLPGTFTCTQARSKPSVPTILGALACPKSRFLLPYGESSGTTPMEDEQESRGDPRAELRCTPWGQRTTLLLLGGLARAISV